MFETLQTRGLTAPQEDTKQLKERDRYDRLGVERRYVPVSLVRDDLMHFEISFGVAGGCDMLCLG